MSRTSGLPQHELTARLLRITDDFSDRLHGVFSRETVTKVADRRRAAGAPRLRQGLRPLGSSKPTGKRYLDWDVADPAGAPLNTVREIRDDIDRRVRDLLTEIKP